MKLVLIDRDGVINDELPNFVKSVDELKIFDQALEGIALLTRAGFTCAVVTNQSVVGRGIITDEALARIHGHLSDAVRARGGNIADIFFCTDSPTQATHRRKPNPGMLVEALYKHKAAAESTPFIGDSLTDLQAALAAGCPRYLVLTGKGKKTAATLPDDLGPVTLCADLHDAALKIAQEYR